MFLFVFLVWIPNVGALRFRLEDDGGEILKQVQDDGTKNVVN